MKQERAANRNLTGDLVDKIRSRIMASDLKEGAVFMTVDQIASEYGVSRTIAREAANQLQALGLLQGRKRVGFVVARPTAPDLMRDWLPLYARSLGGESLRALAELRYALELGSVDLAAANATGAQTGQLSQLAERFAAVTAASGQTREANRIEFEFHCLLLTMTGSPLIAGMHRVLADFFQAAAARNPHWNEVSRSSVREHLMIAEALAARDRELARSLLRKHLERSLEELGPCQETGEGVSSDASTD
jgi:DNA-binding FadR family transcriptional regulator